MKIALVSGFWGQNIGNAFFNIAGKECLEAAGHDVRFIQDQPAYWTFRNEKRGNFSNAWSVLDKLDVDCVVLQGPILTKNFGNIWRSTIERLAARGVAWGVLSGAMRKYTEEELHVFGEVARAHPPLFFSSRDDVTAEQVRTVVPQLRSGIDSAFFLPYTYTPIPLDTEPYCTFNFDHYPEPTLIPAPEGRVQIGGQRFDTEFPSHIDALAHRSKAHAYIASAIDRREHPTHIAGHQIVRPEHRTNPHLPFKVYLRPNAIASDEPWTYLTAYGSSALTLSDRVHACVATLTYGGTAMLHNPGTKRSALFERVGVADISDRPVRLDPELVPRERADLLDFLRSLSVSAPVG